MTDLPMNDKNAITAKKILSVLHAGDMTHLARLIGADPGDRRIKLVETLLHKYSCIPPESIREILALLLVVPESHSGLMRFERFLENAEQNIRIESHTKHFPEIVSIIFRKSAALSVRLSAAPQTAARLASLSDPFMPRIDPAFYLREVEVLCPPSRTSSDKINAIHRMHTIHLARICARNATHAVDIAGISQELSAMAEAVIESCLSLAAEEVLPLYRDSIPAHSLFVLALGKLGGCELNVSSDVDLIYLCERLEGWESLEAMTMHTSLAEHLTRLLAEATSLGYLYRVDTRLRADGVSGPLVRTTEDYLRYLEMRGQAWERQMLLKARPIAGDIESGERFLASVERFIFPTSITRSPNREIVNLKNQIEARLVAKGSKKTHLKLMPGGIRDIEFIVQCLQLLTGGNHPGVRVTGTLPALIKLNEINALSDSELNTLRSAYHLYRKIENALQWRELLPAFTLPDTGEAMAYLEDELGIPRLGETIEKTSRDVRAIYDDVFSSDDDESIEQLALRAAMNPSGDEHARRFLENLGFADSEQSARDLAHLVFGETGLVTEQTLHPSVEPFLARFLEMLSTLPDPGSALAHFKLIANAYRARPVFFDMMNRNPKVFEFLLTITHGSVFMTGLLVQDPSLLDWLVESGELLRNLEVPELKKDLDAVDTSSQDDITFARDCLRIKNLQKLRIGARDITGIAESFETFTELTTLAECILDAVYKRAMRLFLEHRPECRDRLGFAVLAAGKLGARQMNFGSDLDLIFLYEGDDESPEHLELPQHAATLAQTILNLLAGNGVYRVYPVDARLRPEGGNSPLAVSLDEYRRYFKSRASVWERLALVRTRYLSGDSGLGAKTVEEVTRFVYRGPFSAAEIREILSIRGTMIESSVKRSKGFTNIKSGRGGIADIDFLAQTHACHFGNTETTLRRQHTLDILKALAGGFIPRPDAATLEEMLTFLTSVEKAIRIGSGKPVNTLPPGGPELARVARLLGFGNIRRFTRRLGDVMHLTGELYDRLMNALLESADAS